MVSMRKAITGAALVGTTLVGGAIGASLMGSASAQTSTTTQTQPAFDPSKGGHQANGITETLLTGDAKTKAEAAATAAVPDATVQRSETDAEGAAYEVHMQKADGSCVTVKEDKDFKVAGVENGPAGHGPGRPST